MCCEARYAEAPTVFPRFERLTQQGTRVCDCSPPLASFGVGATRAALHRVETIWRSTRIHSDHSVSAKTQVTGANRPASLAASPVLRLRRQRNCERSAGMTRDEWLRAALDAAPEMTDQRWKILMSLLERGAARSVLTDQDRNGCRGE